MGIFHRQTNEEKLEVLTQKIINKQKKQLVKKRKKDKANGIEYYHGKEIINGLVGGKRL